MDINPSKRLHYRLMDLADANLLYEVDQNPVVMKFISGGIPSTMAFINETIVPRLQSYLTPEEGWGIWQINIADTNEYIGWVLVRPMDYFSKSPQYNNIELGWRFKFEAWGKGYASESANHIQQHLASKANIDKFCAIANPDNIGSIRVMEKIGMKYVKTYIHQDPLFTETVVYYERSK